MSPNFILLLISLLVLAGIIFSAWMVHSKVKLPGSFRLKKIEETELSPSERDLLGRYEEELLELGFEKVGEFQVAELAGENLHRIYLHSREATEAMVSVVTSGFRRVPNLEFYTRFQEGGSLSTDQGLVPHYFEIPRERVMQRFPGLNPFRLYQAHQQKLKSLVSQGKKPMPLTRESILRYIEEDQEELLNYQVKQGYFIADSEQDALKPTWKFAFYFIVRNLDPFPFGISNAKFVSALLICTAIMFGGFAFAKYGNVSELLGALALSERQIYYAICTLFATVSSFLLGIIIQRRAFLWAGLISALGVFLFLHNLFPNDWILILISAQAGSAGNRFYEARLSQSPSRLSSQMIVLIVLIILGWMMLTPK